MAMSREGGLMIMGRGAPKESEKFKGYLDFLLLVWPLFEQRVST